jgi:hypothetical protein
VIVLNRLADVPLYSDTGVAKPKKSSTTNNAAVDAVVGSISGASEAVVSKDSCGNAGGSSSSCSSRDEDIHGVMTAERALHFSIILAEINRKYSSVTFRPM